jgi:energy-coupling factor transporter ATP-binding protein EcfA2
MANAASVATDPSAALQMLRDALVRVRLPLHTVDAEPAEYVRDGMVDQLDDYILPRLARLDAPLLVVVGGSTGSGKSTLVNGLVGDVVSASGVLRPTTRSPVLVHNPADAAWFVSDAVLPSLPRVSGDARTDEGRAIRLVASASVPAGIGLLDAPDIDSVASANRELAQHLLAAADLWLFVTSAARYADAVPWEFLREASERAAVVAIVLDRVAPTAVDEIAADLRRMLTEQGLGHAPVFPVEESVLDARKMLPASVTEPIATWLGVLAGDAAERSAVVRQTLAGAVSSLVRRAPTVLTAASEQITVRDELAATTAESYLAAVVQVRAASADGTLLRGEVLARWQEFVGTGEFFQNMEARIGRLRDRIVAAIKGEPEPEVELASAVETELESLIVDAASKAATSVARAWQLTPAGRALLAEPSHAELGRTRTDLQPRVATTIRNWQRAVVDLVRAEGADRRIKARILSFGVNGLGVVLMVVVFAQTAGLSGAELGIAGGTSVLAQRVLEAVFGDQAVRELARRAQDDLIDRVSMLMQDERAAFDQALDRLRIPDDQVDVLTVAIRVARNATQSMPTQSMPTQGMPT